MLYHISHHLRETIHAFNVLHYVSFRAVAGMLTGLILSLIFGTWFIEAARRSFSSKTREYTPENHQAKGSMPTMGGLFIIGVVTTSSLIWCNLSDPHVWVSLACILSLGAVGLWDDLSKIWLGKGISEGVKFRAQWAAALLTVTLWKVWCTPPTVVCVPFFKQFMPNLGILIIPWAAFIIVGTSNAVNLTDGLDGLAIGSLIINFATFGAIAYLAGHVEFAEYLAIPFTNTSELAVIAAILVGASLGFLWYNTYPAQIFMGDVGSLALGGVLAYLAIATRQELLLALAGGLFVVEAVSVIVQVYSFKRYKKRIFRMAPLHHHFELLGWQEAKITVRFGIISLVLCLLALITLKLR